MLYRFIERVKKSEYLDEIVLATTEKKEDDVLCDIAWSLDTNVFRGSENDLINRIYECAKKYEADVVVRLCADNPLIEAKEIDRIIIYYLVSNLSGLFSNTQSINDSGYPDGLGTEVYSMKTFKWMDERINNSYQREHPHDYFYKTDSVQTCRCPEELKYPDIKLDVNTQEDYDFVKRIYDIFGPDCKFTDYIGVIREHDIVASC
jgi:spore coat polysaccharide biosynthesis protein SpsF